MSQPPRRPLGPPVTRRKRRGRPSERNDHSGDNPRRPSPGRSCPEGAIESPPGSCSSAPSTAGFCDAPRRSLDDRSDHGRQDRFDGQGYVGEHAGWPELARATVKGDADAELGYDAGPCRCGERRRPGVPGATRQERRRSGSGPRRRERSCATSELAVRQRCACVRAHRCGARCVGRFRHLPASGCPTRKPIRLQVPFAIPLRNGGRRELRSAEGSSVRRRSGCRPRTSHAYFARCQLR